MGFRVGTLVMLFKSTIAMSSDAEIELSRPRERIDPPIPGSEQGQSSKIYPKI